MTISEMTDKRTDNYIDQVTSLVTSRGYKSSILYEYLNLIKESFPTERLHSKFPLKY